MSVSTERPSVAVGRTAAPDRLPALPLGDEPIRAEIFGLEGLENHARRLAAAARVGRVRPYPLHRRFLENGLELAASHRRIVAGTTREQTITTDAEWLLDNYHIIEDALREVRQDLPQGYYAQLPKLLDAPFRGLPRVYAIAVQLIAHTDSSLDETNVTRFVQAYQQVAPLTIGELWAVPIMLRLALLENLRNLSRKMHHAWQDRDKADAWAQRLAAEHEAGGPFVLRLSELVAREPAALRSDAFLVRLMQILRDHGEEAVHAIEWLEQAVEEYGASVADVLRREHQRQAASQVSVGNCVTSLRVLSSIDWSVFFDRTSLVEAILADDPGGVYALQDFATKDRYRRTVERLARRSRYDELTVARRAVDLAQSAMAVDAEASFRGEASELSHFVSQEGLPLSAFAPRKHVLSRSESRQSATHVGYYLIGPGRCEFRAELGYRPTLRERVYDAAVARAEPLYFGALAGAELALIAAMLTCVHRLGVGWPGLLVMALALLLPVSELAVGLVHQAITWWLPPRVLPKLDFKRGLPPQCATFVVMPSMLVRGDSAQLLAEKLEVHYLSNPDSQLWFALLTDFADAPNERQPEDDSYIDDALARISALNERYCRRGPPRFFLFHRRRQFNPVQGCWMAWERKRGKLIEFNRLLRGARDTSFSVVSGNLSALPRIRYVITLDADTQLPRETARRLVGTLDHPLNRPRFDPRAGRVVEGYGVLQPRVSFDLVAVNRTRFSRILSNSAGLDPYTTASSDVYQDLFGRGSFIGKGIYDVDAFEAAVGQTFPDNQILSHDLIEGNYARCGLTSDIELVDDFPARYHAYARREHRWVRGDWQLLPWLSGVFRSAKAISFEQTEGTLVGDGPYGGDRQAGKPDLRKHGLPLIERWKIFDNLRRSLVPPSLMLLLVLGWTLPAGGAWFWTLIALALLALPLIQLSARTLWQVLRQLDRLAWGGAVVGVAAWLRARRTPTRSASEAESDTGLAYASGWYFPTSHFARRDWACTAAQAGLAMIFLAEQSHRLIDAIARTLYRLYVSGRNRLEWETAASAEQRLGDTLADFGRTMWPAPALAIGLGLLVALVQPVGLLAAGPLLIGWAVSPAVAWWISQPPRRREAPLTDEQLHDLRRIARKTWYFFETFVGEQDRWLPPDNYQEDPKGQIAHRTSPTNIGLYLLSTLAANDLGYLGLCDCVERLEQSFQTLERLPKHQGHLFNWYDTQTLEVLEPSYISTVDSGNFLASLWTLAEGLREKASAPLDVSSWAGGLADALRLAHETFRSVEPVRHGQGDLFEQFEAAFVSAEAILAEAPRAPAIPGDWLARFQEHVETLSRHEQALTAAVHETPEALDHRLDRLAAQARSLARDCTEMPQATWAERIHNLVGRIEKLAEPMHFRFLYNQQRHLFSIGYNHSLGRLDNAHYDLLASEACLTSFLAIARGDVPRKHWFQLGRHLSRAGGGTLLSWGGTMFEYLMPRLFFRRYADTLLDRTWRGAVARQIEYGRQSRVPWGISESGFNALDGNLDYQYQAFGVPGLGLKRGLSRDLVIAPYATALALAVDAQAAASNLRALAAERAEGPFGFYEAVDYTRDRLMEKRRSAVVRSYMAHHQGMALLALTNCLLDGRLRRRFHARPEVRATELLLQERAPVDAPYVEAHGDEATPPAVVRDFVLPMTRKIMTPDTPHPRTLLLSNGSYSVLVTNAGSGYSTWRDLDVTRWREDRTCDAWGQFCYVRDLRTGALWSAGHQPLCRPADHYEVRFSTDKAEIHRRDGNIETHLEITVSPENDAEIRRLTLTNHDTRSHDIELTSYTEVVLSPHRADRAHPAFGKLFLETEYHAGVQALICRRRPRAADQQPHWGLHVLAIDGPLVGDVQYETDRCRFLGRGRTSERPQALEPDATLSGTVGPVLDPVFSLRCRLRVAPGASVCAALTTAAADSREEALKLADQYHDYRGVTRAFELAWAHSQVQLRHLHLSSEEVHLFQHLASKVVYAGRALRGSPSALLANRQGQAGLWRFGISGDKPIVLAHIGQSEQLALARQLLSAHAYWRLQGLEVDLVLVNDDPSGYLDDLHEQLLGLIRASDSHGLVDKPGGIFLRKAAQLNDDDRNLLEAAARVVLNGSRGSLAAQVERRTRAAKPVEPFVPRALEGQPSDESAADAQPAAELTFDNGLGGFTPDGREYVIRIAPHAKDNTRRMVFQAADAEPLRPGKPSYDESLPPAPWINVIANSKAGFLVSESGGGYTWAGNSQMNRLTPWNNDPVADPPGEVVYLRDEATGDVWTPTPLPLGRETATVVRHGQGYTSFEQQRRGIAHELTLFMAAEEPIKFIRLKLRNTSARQRRLAIAFYAEWVLGGVRDDAPMQVITEQDPETGALFARNPFAGDFADAVAFADVNLRPHTITADRTEFLGRNGSVNRPAALSQKHLSGKTGAGLDPCAALMATVELPPGGEQEITFVLGQAANIDECRQLLAQYREPAQVQAAFDDVRHRWQKLLTAVEVRTPNAALDLLVNRWLLYQVQSCRVWGRSAFYQSGGAYGFRDQLQDTMALVYANAAEAREHLLRAASRQFLEGDVQHWWHPPAGRGVRTRFSDDLLWLPFVAAHYLATTGDAAVLDEQVPFLRAAPLRPEQEEDYGLPEVAPDAASLYEHCVRAIEHGSRRGAHGLPLMGTGDWNDGMNRVGAGGKGESVWDAWFLLAILRQWIELAERRGDQVRAAAWRRLSAELSESIETHAWDGQWYRRAYFDDGTSLGSKENTECRIDAIAQAWSVISGAAPAERARQAMGAVDQLLVKPDKRLIMLLTPPFDQGPLQPGYIKGYLPGIRENGGQYTHAATWVVDAMARLGRGTRAVELYDLLNPIHHAQTRDDVDRYRVEPYVVAADIYSQPPHVGRGGWTWYTGSAAWMYRVALESILGFHLQGDRLRIEPCIAADWREYTITYRRGSATYMIRIENPDGLERGASVVTIDGQPADDGVIPLIDDGREHLVVVRLKACHVGA